MNTTTVEKKREERIADYIARIDKLTASLARMPAYRTETARIEAGARHLLSLAQDLANELREATTPPRAAADACSDPVCGALTEEDSVTAHDRQRNGRRWMS